MKIKTDYIFPEQYQLIAKEYISYKHSLGFVFGYDDQKKCDQLATSIPILLLAM